MENVEKLIRTRKQLGMTQAELADALEIGRDYLSRLENGHAPITPKIMKRLDRAVENISIKHAQKELGTVENVEKSISKEFYPEMIPQDTLSRLLHEAIDLLQTATPEQSPRISANVKYLFAEYNRRQAHSKKPK